MALSEKETAIIDCPDCDIKVQATVLCTMDNSQRPFDEDPSHKRYYLLRCPCCQRALLGISTLIQSSFNDAWYPPPTLLWPFPEKKLAHSIPVEVRETIDEAQKCFRAKCFSACAVMCGKALEALCKSHGTEEWTLAGGLKELKIKSVIDERIYSWGEALRSRRNIGAHASGSNVSEEDASDMLDFMIAICEYVYVLTAKYEEFKKREEKSKLKES